MAQSTPEQILEEIEALAADQEITILKLSEPISSEIAHLRQQPQRTSDVSNASLDATTPASLEADLTHYRELFAKLRFSYVEQVTKEKYIRAIVGDPPLIVTSQENVDLERQNLVDKATLKASKTEVADMVSQLEEKAKDLSRKYERVGTETVRLRELPAKIAELEAAVAALREAQASSLSSNPDLNLPLAKTLDLVEAKKRQRDELDRQLDQLQSQVPRKQKELERLRAELHPLETKRNNSVAAAKEAKRRKEAALGGVQDDLEERGRWYRATEAALRQMLEPEG